MPNTVDIAFAVFFSILLMWYETKFDFPRFKARIAAGEPNARRNGYRRTLIGQWIVALAALVIWMRNGRSWTELGVAPVSDWRLVVGVALAAATIAFFTHQVLAIGRASPEKLAAFRPGLAYVEFMLPRTREERRWFIALSITAGICEELLYRGYLMWLLRAYIGVPLAAIGTIVLFGAGHIYQGPKGAMKAGAAAVIMTGTVLLSGWLLPAVLLHAALDVSAGVLGYRVLNHAAAPASVAAGA
jgi:membrane protease YdiL (CAAX protease family)